MGYGILNQEKKFLAAVTVIDGNLRVGPVGRHDPLKLPKAPDFLNNSSLEIKFHKDIMLNPKLGLEIS